MSKPKASFHPGSSADPPLLEPKKRTGRDRVVQKLTQMSTFPWATDYATSLKENFERQPEIGVMNSTTTMSCHTIKDLLIRR
ncbi:hypothetical protein [Arthrobacter sp. NPDC093139]|uniref:hypothetical protein n=1 Tax=Arthrobacter sp. NPDC093139 TaxID=3363945 RepID=UPI0038120060